MGLATLLSKQLSKGPHIYTHNIDMDENITLFKDQIPLVLR
jgi:hypothetical protein